MGDEIDYARGYDDDLTPSDRLADDENGQIFGGEDIPTDDGSDQVRDFCTTSPVRLSYYFLRLTGIQRWPISSA